MKDLITILVCNAIRRAEHKTGEKGEQLSDKEVLDIAMQAQLDYHKTEIHRFMNQFNSEIKAESPKPRVIAGGTVTPPKDMVAAAKASLGDRYDEFVAKYPGEITPLKLCRFLEES